jgi:hypothetical protein
MGRALLQICDATQLHSWETGLHPNDQNVSGANTYAKRTAPLYRLIITSIMPMPTKPDQVVQIHTHYDNLKIARNAPPEVVRAAYKTLSQKFHPDRNSDKEGATRTFQIINSAYEVLSDPVKRKAHDEWIVATEAKNHSAENGPDPATMHRISENNTPRRELESGNLIKHAIQYRDRTFKNLRLALRGRLDKRQAFNYLLWTAVASLIIFIILIS